MADVSRETESALERYWALLRKWSGRINLIGATTVQRGWQRHIEDSLQLVEFLPPRAVHQGDLGSGGGLPAIPMHVARRAMGFEDRLTLIEADARKAAFLRSACRDLGIAAQIQADRLDRVPPLEADVITARALAPLPQLLPMVKRHLCPGGIAILPKGRRARSELAFARDAWSFTVETHPSRTDPEALILRIANIDQKM